MREYLKIAAAVICLLLLLTVVPWAMWKINRAWNYSSILGGYEDMVD